MSWALLRSPQASTARDSRAGLSVVKPPRTSFLCHFNQSDGQDPLTLSPFRKALRDGTGLSCDELRGAGETCISPWRRP